MGMSTTCKDRSARCAVASKAHMHMRMVRQQVNAHMAQLNLQAQVKKAKSRKSSQESEGKQFKAT